MHKHEHEHSHNHSHSKENIKLVFLLNLIFSIIELIGSILTNSISILSDAIHDFGDSFSIGVSYLLEKYSSKKSNNKYTYGYLRYSLLGALITCLVLLIGSFIVLYRAIPRLLNPVVVNSTSMIIISIFGFIINGYAAYKTSHSTNINEKSINLHMLEDVLGWFSVLLGSIIIKLTNFYIIDPILSIFIALYILFHAYSHIKEVFDIFMQKVPDNIDINKIKKNLEKKFDSIKDIHHIHVWTMDGEKNYLTAHILLNSKLSESNIKKLKSDIKEYLHDLNIEHCTLEIEYFDEKCDSLNC